MRSILRRLKRSLEEERRTGRSVFLDSAANKASVSRLFAYEERITRWRSLNQLTPHRQPKVGRSG